MNLQEKLLKSISSKNQRKQILSSKFKHIYGYKINKDIIWQAYIPKYKWSKHFINEREAAKSVDLKLIENNINPVNILIKN